MSNTKETSKVDMSDCEEEMLSQMFFPNHNK